ncbi:hypothetical protein CTA1_9478 [Colletotrichum tanaceti]|uniref:Uncharacterized protein n=1 Tax=Colletotrichum tanaceti TaxID=1306861 RepID=A0A4U6XJ55_9PEZI|nr:hypothetical protein CTA1_9478 [Colletotrichum tanaceti]
MAAAGPLLGGLLDLELVDPRLGSGRRHDVDPHDAVDDLDVAAAQDLEQRRLLADLDEPALGRLHVALDAVGRVLAPLVPRHRQDVRQVVRQALGLAKGLDEVAFEVDRVQQHGREAQVARGVVLVWHEAHSRVLHLGRLLRLPRPNAPRRERRPQQPRPQLLAGLALRLAPCLGVGPLGRLDNVPRDGPKGLVVRVEREPARARVVGLGDAADLEQGARRAVVGLDVRRVQAQREAAVGPARAVVAELEVAGGAVDVQALEDGLLLGNLIVVILDLDISFLLLLFFLLLSRGVLGVSPNACLLLVECLLAPGPPPLLEGEDLDALGVELLGIGVHAGLEALVAALLELLAVLARSALVRERLQRRDVVIVLKLRHEERRLVEVREHLVRRLAAEQGVAGRQGGALCGPGGGGLARSRRRRRRLGCVAALRLGDHGVGHLVGDLVELHGCGRPRFSRHRIWSIAVTLGVSV